MEKFLIFTGAGISVPLGLPSTVDFMDDINSGAARVTEQVCSYLKKNGNDIERILSSLEEFSEQSSLYEYVINSEASLKHIKPHIERYISTLRDDIDAELSRIKSIVHDRLSEIDSNNSADMYINLIKEVMRCSENPAISIITANYDLTFERGFEDFNDKWSEIGVTDIDYGFKPQYSRVIYDPVRKFEWQSDIVEFLKIHGSVDWHKDANGKCSRTMSTTKPFDPDQMVILYPGFKGIPKDEPFRSLHDSLVNRLDDADYIIIIGFAFRDPYINSLFEYALRSNPNKMFYCINPESIDNFPDDSLIPRFNDIFENFIHIKKGVDISENPLNLNEVLKKE